MGLLHIPVILIPSYLVLDRDPFLWTWVLGYLKRGYMSLARTDLIDLTDIRRTRYKGQGHGKRAGHDSYKSPNQLPGVRSRSCGSPTSTTRP